MSLSDTDHERINDYVAVRIRLASPTEIRSWSQGVVRRAETINHRTFRPEKEGLFCERIFGPEREYECSCGKYKGLKFKGTICDRCGVEVTVATGRRRRMGHIELAAPVVHIWFFKSRPAHIAVLLDLNAKDLEEVIYYQAHIVTDPKNTPLREGQILTPEECSQYVAQYGVGSFEASTGADAIKKLLQRLNLVELSKELRAQLRTASSKQRRRELIRRLKVVEALRDSGNRPEWMVLECIPVIPPNLRPIVPLPTGNFAVSDLNDLYRRVTNRTNRLKKLMELDAPEVIIRNEKRMLQQSVDALFDNSRCTRPVMGSSNRPLKSLSDMIKGKEGRFRETLLGKRVDFSARSVIVVDPQLALDQCGLPKRIAYELYRPFLVRRLLELGYVDSRESAEIVVKRRPAVAQMLLRDVLRNYPVLLNRTPTRQRTALQAFEPVLVEGAAIRIHPFLCRAFDTKLDGDEMVVHLPLSVEAIVEAATLMSPAHNIFSPMHGNPVIGPSQDVVAGCYVASVIVDQEPAVDKCFANPEEAIYAYEHGVVDLRARIKVRLPKTKTRVVGDGQESYKPGGLINTSVGRLLFNEILHEKMPFYNLPLRDKELNEIIVECDELLGRKETVDLLDRMKELGFRFATKMGLSHGTEFHLVRPADEEEVPVVPGGEGSPRTVAGGRLDLADLGQHVLRAWTNVGQTFRRWFLGTGDGQRGEWNTATQSLNESFCSEAPGSEKQVKAVGRGREPVSKSFGQMPQTRTFSTPHGGPGLLEYFRAACCVRRQLIEALRARIDGSYLMRRLVYAVQSVVVTCHDCGTAGGITKSAVNDGDVVSVPLWRAIHGRVSRSSLVDAATGELVVRENQLITKEVAQRIESMGIQKFAVRSPLCCEAPLGVCQLCYGMDLSTGELVEQGSAVGLIAAQSIGEAVIRFTTLGLRDAESVYPPFGQDNDTGGRFWESFPPRSSTPGQTEPTLSGAERAAADGARDAISRLNQLFDAQSPARPAVLAEIDGVIELPEKRVRGKRIVRVVNRKTGMQVDHLVTPERRLRVEHGDRVRAGDPLSEGSVDPRDILRVLGVRAVQEYLLREIRAVYRAHRVEIDDKHTEILIAQMLRKVLVEDPGDTGLLPDTQIDRHRFGQMNRRLRRLGKITDPGDTQFEVGATVPLESLEKENACVVGKGGAPAKWGQPRPATARPLLLGVTQLGVRSESFLAAASARETVRVLTEAALAGKRDSLLGLVENVIVGRLIPAGTGFPAYLRSNVPVSDAIVGQPCAAPHDQPPPQQDPVRCSGRAR